MAFSKEERRVLRWVKTVFFLISMLISLVLLSAPIVFVIADTILPAAILSAAPPPVAVSGKSLRSHLSDYDFRSSLVDIPIVSIVRSVIILYVYTLCDGPRLSGGLYLGTVTVCSVLSFTFLSLKATYVFGKGSRWANMNVGNYDSALAMEMGVFACSFAMAIAHIVVAYRISCRERRKLLVYKIDIEAVSACKNGFLRYPKVLQERAKL